MTETSPVPGIPRLGFLSFVASGEPSGRNLTPREALQNQIDLTVYAEEIGVDSAWIRVRHLEPYISSPIALLSAAAARTSNIHLGTGVFQIRYEHPHRLAEELGAIDLLSGGRLQIGAGNGLGPIRNTLDKVFGEPRHDPASPLDSTIQNLLEFKETLKGKVLAIGDGTYFKEGQELRITPSATGLADRLWRGPGSTATAIEAGRDGLNLLLSTLSGENHGLTYEELQLRQILAYKQAYADAGHVRQPSVAVSRLLYAYKTQADKEALQTATEKFHSPELLGKVKNEPGGKFHAVDNYFGTPEEVAARILADVTLPHVTDLIFTLPPFLAQETIKNTLKTLVQDVLPIVRAELPSVA
jgi:alkanesulfonate monooxygenase SsuD/methylene tetrahydromethanopterin reductase-like flavin-dependent oxidoreductase (luciferase family)